MRRAYILSTVLLLTTFVAQSQSFYSIRKERTLIANGGLGSANYFGELTNPRSMGEVKYGLNLGLEKYFTNRISGRFDINGYRISGDDAKANSSRVVRNLSFVSNNLEINTLFSVDLLPNGVRFYQRPVMNFYGFIGFGVTLINPKTRYTGPDVAGPDGQIVHDGDMVALQPLQTENVHYSRVQPIIPMGGGVRFKMGPFFNLAVEGGLRKTFTDYLDDISVRDYPDPTTLSSPLTVALSKRGEAEVRGNPNADDWYFMINAKVQYYLPSDFLGGKNSNRKLYTKKRKSFSKPRRR